MKEEKKKIYQKTKTSKRNPIFKLLNLKWMFIRSPFFVVLFNVLNKVIITMPNRKMKPFKWKLLNSTSCGAVYYDVQSGSNFWIGRWNPEVWPFKWKLLSSTFLWFCLLSGAEVIGSCYYYMLNKAILTFESIKRCTFRRDHSNESS